MFRKINIKNLGIMKQILISFSFRLMGPAIMLVTTPQLFSNLGYMDYGIWSLLITTIGWLTICDFGITNQVRNESKILIVQDNRENIGVIYTTAFIISISLTLLCCIIIALINFELKYKLFLSVVFLCIIQTNVCRAICFSLDKPELAIAVTNIPNLFLLVYVSFYSSFNIDDIMAIYCYGSVIMFISIFIVLYKHKVKLLLSVFRPATLAFSITKYSLLKGGGGFFMVQLVSMGLIISDRYIISYIYSISDVSKYDLIFKIANFCIMFFSIVNTVLWSKFTEFWMQGNHQRIKVIFRFFDLSFLLLILALILILSEIKWIFELWLNITNINYSKLYLVGVILYLVGYYWMSAYSSFLNGVSIIKKQFIIQASILLIKFIALLVVVTALKTLNVEYVILLGGGCLFIVGFLFRKCAHDKVNSFI
ncbi:TPA: hypothetical protein O3K43_003822 [Escherichia albertii]|nr:hypothetical protein [Escherichia albertii]